MTVNQHAQHLNHETEAAKLNSAIINCIIYACVFPTVQVFLKHKLSKRGFFIDVTYYEQIIKGDLIRRCSKRILQLKEIICA